MLLNAGLRLSGDVVVSLDMDLTIDLDFTGAAFRLLPVKLLFLLA